MAEPKQTKESIKPEVSLDANEIAVLSTQPLGELRQKIVEALVVDYNEDAADAALKYITKEMDTSEELIDDLEIGHEESSLVDAIIANSGIPASKSQTILKLLIRAVSDKWINEKVTKVGKIHFYPEIVEAPKKININSKGNQSPYPSSTPSTPTPSFTEQQQYEDDEKKSNDDIPELQETKEWLLKQWDDTFSSFDQNLDLMKLFAIGKKQDMAHLPGVLHEVYSQWRINYLIDRKKRGKNAKQPILSDFIRKSKAFKQLPEKNKTLVASGVGTYGRRFSPQPIITPLFEIKDDLFEYVQYSYIMSEAINNLITANSIVLPLQIDFWIIPKKIGTTITEFDDDDDDDDDGDDDEKSVLQDFSVLNIEQRLKLDKEVKYDKFTADKSYKNLQRTLQKKIEDALKNKKQSSSHNRKESHNRLVCIADRRDKYYDFKLLGDEDKAKYLRQRKEEENNDNDNNNNNNNNNNDNDKEEISPIIEIDINNENTREFDEIFIYQPPREYGQFPHDYGQEHLQYLSREYMIPKTIIKHPKRGHYETTQGAYNDFNSQMFAISFCCHSKTDIRLQWFINGWNMRIPKLENFIKIWPEFFEKTKKNKENIDKIKKEILKNWKLPIRNKEYEMYEKDLLRFEHIKKNGQNT